MRTCKDLLISYTLLIKSNDTQMREIKNNRTPSNTNLNHWRDAHDKQYAVRKNLNNIRRSTFCMVIYKYR